MILTLNVGKSFKCDLCDFLNSTFDNELFKIFETVDFHNIFSTFCQWTLDIYGKIIHPSGGFMLSDLGNQKNILRSKKMSGEISHMVTECEEAILGPKAIP